MKIAEDGRKYAAEHQLSENDGLQGRMEEKAREFAEAGVEVYSKV